MTHQTSVSPPDKTRSPLPLWRFAAPLILQIGLILVSPAQSVYTSITGKTVILQTLPVDPYDPLRGYSQTLDYDISHLENLQKLPGWQQVKQNTSNTDYLNPGTQLYVVLAAPTGINQPPQAWKPVMVSSNLPTSLPANQIALKGVGSGRSIRYGLETYYFPESQQQEINQAITQSQRRQQRSLLMEIKVDNRGHSVPISLWVDRRNYRF